ncbi:hypothetical protein EON79_10970 [bacterium]|nr:MAG: hypothetical protein EON79_10970 [bacterium]
MDLSTALLESWDREVRILDAIATRVTEETRAALPSPDGWPLDRHLAHIHNVRKGWLVETAPERGEALPTIFRSDEGELVLDEAGTLPAGLDEIKRLLGLSAGAVRDTVAEALPDGDAPLGPYTHPVHFLMHMIWHEGWHAGLILTGLRLAGHEPSEEWEEEQVWSVWRFGVPTPWTG